MSKSQESPSVLSRITVFLMGGATTLLLASLIVLCVPKKPDVIADAPIPASLGEMPVEASQGAQENQQPTGPSSVRGGSTGERLYARFCASCHGADGKAQTTMSRMMSPPPTNFYSGPWKGEMTAAAIIEVVKNGKGAMPAYGKEITLDGELNALAEHVLSLREVKKE